VKYEVSTDYHCNAGRSKGRRNKEEGLDEGNGELVLVAERKILNHSTLVNISAMETDTPKLIHPLFSRLV
jgi:hypothetical protein